MNAAAILVECGYADAINEDHVMIAYPSWPDGQPEFSEQAVEWDQDTLEGRRQADAIEDWLRKEQYIGIEESLWKRSGFIDCKGIKNGYHQWRLDRIKWCLQAIMESTR